MPAITNATQLTQTGIAVRPIVTGQPAKARRSCRNDGENRAGKTRVGNQIQKQLPY